MKLTKLMKLGSIIVLIGGGIFLVSRFVGQTLPGAVRSEATVASLDGLVGYWNMDDQDVSSDTVYDKSGEGNNGTKNGTGGGNNKPQSITGKIKQALDFDGTDDYLDIANNATLNITTNITVAAWVKLDVTGAFQRIYSSGTQSNAWEFGISDTNKITFTEVLIADNFGSASLSANQWYHIAFVKSGDSGTNVTLYLNGVADGTASVGTVSAPSGSKKIGRRGDISTDYINGQLDEVRVYNRALSAAEISKIFNASGRVEMFNAPSLIEVLGYWNMDNQDISGTVVFDKSGLGRNGTVNGVTTGTSGKINEALSYDGLNDTLTVGDVNFSGNAFSVAAWIYPTAWGSASNAYIHNIFCDENGSNTTFCYRLGSQGLSSLKQRCAVNVKSGSNTDNDRESNTDLVLNTWQHCAVTFDGSNTRFYINGILDRTQATSVTMKNGTAGFHIGSSPAGDRYFEGSLDEVRVFDRVLSAAEVSALSGYRPATIATAQGGSNIGNLIGYWSFNGQDMDWSNASAEAVDRSGNNNHGNVINFGPGSVDVGKVGQALIFDGADDYIDAGDIATLDDPGELTGCAWVYHDTTDDDDYIMSKSDSSSSGFLFLRDDVGSSSGRTDMYKIYVRSGAGTQAFIEGATNSSPLQDWTYVCFTFVENNSNGLRLYINGAEDANSPASTSGITDLNAGTDTFQIGVQRTTLNELKGRIDEVRLYGRALAALEILELYQGR